MRRHSKTNDQTSRQPHGSTLVIVIAMLGLLSFMGTMFYLFAIQERSNAENFSAAAKIAGFDADDPFPWALQQLITGTNAYQKFSILGDTSGTSRHSMMSNLIGADGTPYTGAGVRVVYDGAGLPIVDDDYNGAADGTDIATADNLLNFVDSAAAWADTVNESTLSATRNYNNGLPQPDVDYTTSDINTQFLATKSWAIRDNGEFATPRFERVQVIIPSFFRPQYLKSSTANSSAGLNVPTDYNWYDPAAHPQYQRRSFRPHQNHIGGYDAAGNPVYRFLQASRDSGVLPTAGAFPFTPGEGDNTANFGKLGVWTGDLPEDALGFELDSDNDGDGIKEGIWMDLQYPIQETTDGRFYATLHSFTIYDLDALIDLNSHGNLAQLPRNASINGSFLGPTGLGAVPLSDSNQGLGPNEISPIYALVPDTPGTDQRFIDWYTANPTSSLEQANMEWLWLLTGRMDHDGTGWSDLSPGRWGDANALVYNKVSAASAVNTLPRPGRAGNLAAASDSAPSFDGVQGDDDNLDSLEGIKSTITGVLRGFVHPMDYAGTGENRQSVALGYPSPDFRLPAMLQDLTGRPEAWLAYAGYSAVSSVNSTPNESLYMRGRDTDPDTADDLSRNHFFDALFEDPLEMIMDLDFTLRPDDQMFSVQDMLIGHLTDTDKTAAPSEVSERLRKLMPMTYAIGSDRADRFTTLSNSFRQVPFLEQPGGARSWEWTADADGDTKLEFPPKFGTVTPYSALDPFRAEVRRLLTIEVGEQRESLGQLLLSINHILDINRPGPVPPENTPLYRSYMERFGLQFRAMTEHPDQTAAATVTAMPLTQPNFPPQNAADQEYWARRDRQKLARDIYVLLYTLGGAEVSGATVVNYTDTNSDRSKYSEKRLRQMAQFAVNMVDAMDTDNVATRFEFDKNLNDGWGLDDLPWTDSDAAATTETTTSTDVNENGLYPEDAINRGVVYGVEAQQLAFSEVLAVHSPDFTSTTAADDNASEHTNQDDRYLLHVELQNALPISLDLAVPGVTGVANEDNGVWRLSRFDRNAAAAASQSSGTTQTLTLMEGNSPLGGGDRFTIAMAALDGTPTEPNPTGFGTADLYMDADVDTNFNLISPDVTSATITSGATPLPLCDLDLIHTSHDPRWLLSGNSTDRGKFLDAMLDYKGNDNYGIEAVSGTNGVRKGFDLVLQRRQNPNLPLLPTTENPWIEVDRIKAEFIELYDLDTGAMTASLSLTDLKSLERHEVLDARQFSHASAQVASPGTGVAPYNAATDFTPNTDRLNTIGSNLNSRTDDGTGTSVFELWQAHFDRDYASTGELLNLPIVGPKLLTRSLDPMRSPGFQQALLPISPSTVADSPDNIAGAAGMILQSDAAGVNTALDNAWYRLLQFVEVPSRVNRLLGNYINLQRVPGKLNLNTIRHRQVYAGLLDDLNIADLPPMTDADGNGDLNGPFLISTAPDGDDATPGSSSRDRWLEFINERDGYVNTVNAGSATQMWLPATPNSHPFRSLAYTTGVTGATASPSDTGIDHTILRRGSLHRPARIADNAGLPIDNAFGETTDVATTNRHWMEPGDTAFHLDPDSVAGGRTANMVHRHQFLSKIMNNTTTTSNCFIAYGTAAYFEAVLDASGVFRLGGRMGLDLDADNNPYNDAGWEQRAVFVVDRTEAFNAYDADLGAFDWERLVKHRLDLASDGQ